MDAELSLQGAAGHSSSSRGSGGAGCRQRQSSWLQDRDKDNSPYAQECATGPVQGPVNAHGH